MCRMICWTARRYARNLPRPAIKKTINKQARSLRRKMGVSKMKQLLERAAAFGAPRIGIRLASSSAPEARRRLAGGEAQRSHRKPGAYESRPEGAQDKSNSGVPAGTRKIFYHLSRWLRFAPPPANFRRPSGAQNNCPIKSVALLMAVCATVMAQNPIIK